MAQPPLPPPVDALGLQQLTGDYEKARLDIHNEAGEVIGSVYDTPIVVYDDAECQVLIRRLMDAPVLAARKELLERCWQAVTAEVAESLQLTSDDLVTLLEMMLEHPEYCHDIQAVLNFLAETTLWEGDLPDDYNLRMANLCGLMGAATLVT